MRTHLLSAPATLRIDPDLLKQSGGDRIDRFRAHGGFFKTPVAGAPVSVTGTADESGRTA